MSYEVQFENVPAGICLTAGREGESIQVQYSGNATSEDGEQLILYLGFATNCLDLVRRCGQHFAPSQIDNMLAIIRKDRTATIYVNELQQIFSCRAGRPIKAGELIAEDDVVDIIESRFDGIEIPIDSGYLIVCSFGWRKGVLFDFGPVGAACEPRNYDVWQAFGSVAARLQFQKRFAISNEDWSTLFSDLWFPFAGLSQTTIDKILSHLRAGWSTSELLPEIHSDILKKIDGFFDSWRKKAEFQDHIPFLETAIERFKANDFVSCVSILFTRIEGILRKYHLLSKSYGERNQHTLASIMVPPEANPYSLLLPHRFAEYLKATYFASFDEAAGKLDLSRNSVGHGVAKSEDFNLKSAIVGLLICNQLFFTFPVTNSDTKE